MTNTGSLYFLLLYSSTLLKLGALRVLRHMVLRHMWLDLPHFYLEHEEILSSPDSRSQLFPTHFLGNNRSKVWLTSINVYSGGISISAKGKKKNLRYRWDYKASTSKIHSILRVLHIILNSSYEQFIYLNIYMVNIHVHGDLKFISDIFLNYSLLCLMKSLLKPRAHWQSSL